MLRFALLLSPLALIALLSGCGSDEAKPEPSGPPSVGDMVPDEGGDETGFVSIFDGETLDGWEGDRELWRVEDGAIVGETTGEGIDYNAFLATTEEYEDFELRLELRLVDGEGNSGVQFRSKPQPDSPQVEGYQADVGVKYWGCLYDEARRDEMLASAPRELKRVLKPDGWNDYRIRVEGDHVLLTLNGMRTVDFHEEDEAIARSGIVALQIHSGPPMRIEFRNLRIRRLGDATTGTGER